MSTFTFTALAWKPLKGKPKIKPVVCKDSSYKFKYKDGGWKCCKKLKSNNPSKKYRCSRNQLPKCKGKLTFKKKNKTMYCVTKR